MPHAALLQRLLAENGLDPEPLTAALRSKDSVEALKVLGDLAERRYQGRKDTPSREIVAKLKDAISDAVRGTVSTLWNRDGVSLDPSAPVHEGGFSWVIKVSFRGEPCALVVPKFTRGDYAERIAIRSEAGRLLPRSERFSMPRPIRNFDSPVPACLVSYVTGDNCYPRTFDAAGKPHTTAPGPQPGIEVFRKLGELAAGFTSVQGERFGKLVNPTYASATEYLRSHTDVIEKVVLADPSLNLRPYAMTLAQLQRVVDWVKKDAQDQKVSHMMHGDLSPWNLLHDAATGAWTIVDGDDAKFGILGEQLGVCLNSMRGNFNRAWIDALLDGYGATTESERRNALLRGAAYGVVTYGLTNAAHPWDLTNVEMCRDVAFSYLAPSMALFDELVPAA